MKRLLILMALLMLPSGTAMAECKRHIELIPADELAQEAGRSTMWVLGNVKIFLWEKSTPQGKGNRVGNMRPGSRAVILEESPDDYKVKSPLDESVGWVNKVQVKRTLMQDHSTFTRCK